MAYPADAPGDLSISSFGDVEDALKFESVRYKQQTLAYAATITPDPSLGEIIVIGALTGALTIANPPANAKQIGRRMKLIWSQDATGGRVITFGADFLSGAAPATTLSKTFTQSFSWNGTNWVADGAAFLLN